MHLTPSERSTIHGLYYAGTCSLCTLLAHLRDAGEDRREREVRSDLRNLVMGGLVSIKPASGGQPTTWDVTPAGRLAVEG